MATFRIHIDIADEHVDTVLPKLTERVAASIKENWDDWDPTLVIVGQVLHESTMEELGEYTIVQIAEGQL